ncbi:MAG: hypothetical protein EOM12_16495, partial [Verrucomicrobiae bacterium]|nr:hypothetical protein [Verrucomicrobiae bacterium]
MDKFRENQQALYRNRMSTCPGKLTQANRSGNDEKGRPTNMPLTIIRIDIAKMHVDAIVNSTRRRPVMGYGTDAYLHSIAGPDMLKERQR